MPGWYKKTKPMLYTFVIGMGAFNVIIPHFVLLELHQRITQIIFVHKSSLFYMNKANLELKLFCQLLLSLSFSCFPYVQLIAMQSFLTSSKPSAQEKF